MRFDVITIFPKMFESPLKEGIVGQAINHGLIQFQTWNPRDHATDNHRSVDDRPYGGGDGMVMLPEILRDTLNAVWMQHKLEKRRVVYLSPQGPVLTDQKARQLAQDYEQIVFICGRYGGIDERFIENHVDEELSVGDYILSGGELGAVVAIDTMARFIPGVLGNADSSLEETFKNNLLEHPLYTRPREFEGKTVPEVLLSGNHAKIDDWRREKQVERTKSKRPDLLAASREKAAPVTSPVPKIAVGLVHYPVYNKNGDVVATNVTNLDIHDIARACRTYGIDHYYIITPADEQLKFVGRVLEHWQEGRGLEYNPTRSDSLVNTKLAMSVEAAIEDWGMKDAKVVATSARQVAGPEFIGYGQMLEMLTKEPVFLIFGTGYGLENSLVRRCDYLLEAIKGCAPDGFKHLSVRSAVSIILDRLLGSC